MPSMKLPVLVEMDGGAEHTVYIDQRDLARWEAADLPDKQHTKLRFLAWSAMTRTGRTAHTWDDFNLRECVEAGDPLAEDDDPEGPDGADSLDPGPRDQSAAS